MTQMETCFWAQVFLQATHARANRQAMACYGFRCSNLFFFLWNRCTISSQSTWTFLEDFWSWGSWDHLTLNTLQIACVIFFSYIKYSFWEAIIPGSFGALSNCYLSLNSDNGSNNNILHYWAARPAAQPSTYTILVNPDNSPWWILFLPPFYRHQQDLNACWLDSTCTL